MADFPFPALVPPPGGSLKIPALPLLQGEASHVSLGSEPIQFSLVIPTYNESANIENLVRVLSSLLDQAIPNRYELIVVDDDSRDRTWELAQSLTLEFPQLRVMRRQAERGLSTAVIRGWQVARGEILGVIDGDLQHPPEVLLQLLQATQAGADLAVASRHVEGGGVSSWSVVRRVLSRGAQLLGLVLLPSVMGRVSDPMSGYFLVQRSAIAECTLSPIGYKILVEVLGRGRVRQIAEVGYVFRERQEGESKVTYRQYLEYIQHLLRLRFDLWPVKRFLQFSAVGLTGLVVDMAGLYLLHGVWGFPLTRSAIVSAELAIINNFLWNDLWTFRDISQAQKHWTQRLKRLLKFNLVCLMGVILKVLLLNLLFNLFGINEYLANLLAIAAVTLWNFWINLKLNWRVTAVN